MQLPMLDLQSEYRHIRSDVESALKRCMEHQRWILGPEVGDLEKKMAASIGVKHAVGVASGTDALLLALRALAIRLKGKEYFERDDRIITTPFTFTATGDAILRAGASPLFVDIDPGTFNIDHVRIKEALASPGLENVVGIIPVHLYGQPCRIDEIIGIAGQHNLFVVEDVAQAFGGAWNGRRLGSFGDVNAFSFFPSKNLGGWGDGGMATTDDPDLAELVRMLGKHGGRDKYNVDHVGYNSRLDTIQAAILLAKFKHIEDFNERRRKVASLYGEELAGLEGIAIPFCHLPEQAYHVYNQYTIRIFDNRRDEVQKALKEKGITTVVYYPVPLHKMKVFSGNCEVAGTVAATEKAAREVLSLPIGPFLEEGAIAYVCESLKGIMS